MKLKCDRCNHVGTPLIKMGGLICAKCRYVLKLPDTVDYKTFYASMKKRVEG